MQSSKIADVIIFTARKELATMATDHLKMKGVSSIFVYDKVDDTTDALANYQKAFLIVDWQNDATKVVKVLAFNRKRHPDQLRPILLISDQINDQLIVTAAEYSVTQIFAEELTFKNLASRLTSLIMIDSLPSDIKKVLNQVADARKVEDWKLSLSLLQKCLAKNPTNQRLKCEAAESLLYMGDYENALKILEPFRSGKPPYLRGQHMLSRCLLKLGKADEAQQILSSTMLFNPYDTERIVDLGRALFQLERYQEASTQFDAALKIDGKHQGALLGKSKCSLLEGDVNDALLILKDITSPVEMASVFNTCAVITMRKGKHEAGMDLYRTALKAIGSNSELQARLFFNMGIGYRRQNLKDKAKACYDNAIKLDPTFSKAKEHIEQMTTPTASSINQTQGIDIQARLDLKDKDKQKPETQNPAGMPDFTADLQSLLNNDHEEESLFDRVS
jgi:tetratricopeptide (TPR) repeat protein